MGKDKLIFHQFKLNEIALLLIAEPKSKEYIWLLMDINPNLRNGYLSTELTKFALYTLKGKHHIHWIKDLKSFKKMSKEFSWVTKRSNLFENCKYSITSNLIFKPQSFDLFSNILTHRKSTRKPFRLIYRTEKDTKLILNQIKTAYNIHG